ncbi:MAG: glycosyltransferase family 2 protein [Pseudomonadota bacterium]
MTVSASELQLAALVVSYHTGPRLKECLYALHSDPTVSEIILIDNGNPPQMQCWLDHWAGPEHRCRLIRPSKNLGFGRAVNLAAAQTAAHWLLVVNPDAVVKRGAADRLMKTATDFSEPSIVGGRIFDLHGREERGPRRRELTLFRAITSALGWNTWTLERTPPPTTAVTMPVISGAFFLTSAKSFAALGGFDERYFLHVEDVDLCARCWAAGGKVVYEPRAGALHYGATSNVSPRTVSAHKRDSLRLYFRSRARGPFHRAAIEIVLFGLRLVQR